MMAQNNESVESKITYPIFRYEVMYCDEEGSHSFESYNTLEEAVQYAQWFADEEQQPYYITRWIETENDYNPDSTFEQVTVSPTAYKPAPAKHTKDERTMASNKYSYSISADGPITKIEDYDALADAIDAARMRAKEDDEPYYLDRWLILQEGDAEPDPDFDVLAFYPPAQEKIRNDAPETAAERDRLKEVNQDLLEALQAFVDYLDSDLSEAEEILLEQAKAAIAKAVGK